MEKLKAANIDAYPQEVLADEEPKYLRRQKPLEIKRRKFGKKAWKSYARWSVVGAVALGLAGVSYLLGHFLLASEQMALSHPDQIHLAGAHYVPMSNILEIFRADRNHSVLRIPLDERRKQIESIPWVEQATVLRALPNRIEVEITERTPIAFLREGGTLALIDAHGVILSRPLKGDFHFPVVTGISEDMPLEDREQRMRLFASFTQQIESARAGSIDQVNEVNLTEAKDVCATIAGLQGNAPSGAGADGESFADAAPLIVHFGDTDFRDRYTSLINEIGKWNASKGLLHSVDLRFAGEAVTVPESNVYAKNSDSAASPMPAADAAPAAKPSHVAPPAKHSHAPAKTAAKTSAKTVSKTSAKTPVKASAKHSQ